MNTTGFFKIGGEDEREIAECRRRGGRKRFQTVGGWQ